MNNFIEIGGKQYAVSVLDNGEYRIEGKTLDEFIETAPKEVVEKMAWLGAQIMKKHLVTE